MKRNFLKHFYPEDPDSVQFNFYFKSIEAWLKSVFELVGGGSVIKGRDLSSLFKFYKLYYNFQN